MLRRVDKFFLAVAVLMLLRLMGMVWMPLMDASEPRYAEIARVMMETGDWITPWFKPGVPFWGKPPLSFWAQALSMRWLGVSEFSARLPAWIAMLMTLYAIWVVGRHHGGRRAANWAILIYASSALPFVASGAVLTDPFLVLGTTLAMAGFLLPSWHWKVLATLGVAIGLLAKGPLTLVLVGGPVVLSGIFARDPASAAGAFRKFCLSGLLAVMVALPWYLMAEWKTPGFLEYFLVGEHWNRFVHPGWHGDLYGFAHRKPYGAILLYWLLGTFPWGIVAMIWLGVGVIRCSILQRWKARLARPGEGLLLGWVVFALLFFTFSGNVIWTYTLPAIPAFAIVLGRAIATRLRYRSLIQRHRLIKVFSICAMVAPALALVIFTAVMINAVSTRTERGLVRQAGAISGGELPIWYVDYMPFSARFYSRGHARLVSSKEIPSLVERPESMLFAIERSSLEDIRKLLGARAAIMGGSTGFALVHVQARGEEGH
jgi:4-amino-4-deoxy-L-arabinose transferase-like glycosyltransferase